MRILTLLLLPLVATALPGQGRLTIDDETLAAIVARMVPLVEKHTGRTFDAPPEVLLSDSKEIAESLTADYFVTLKKLASPADEELVRWFARFKAHTEASAFMGKFGLSDRLLFVAPQVVPIILQVLDIDDATGRDVFELVIAHELTHALQHQELDLLARVEAIDQQDRIHTFNAQIEGHAVFVQERIAEELSLQDAARAFRKMLGGDPVLGSASALTAFALRSARKIGHTYYLLGADRVAGWFEQGGHERIWQELAAPPQPSRVLFTGTDGDPAPTQPYADPSATLAGAERVLGERNWLVLRSDIGEALLRSENVHCDDLDDVLGGFRGGALLECHLRGTTQLGLICLLSFADEDAAARFVAAAEHSTAVDAAAENGATSTFEDIVCPAPLTGRRYVQLPQAVTGGARGSLQWLRRGRHVLQVYAVGFVAEDAPVVELAAGAFEKLLAR